MSLDRGRTSAIARQTAALSRLTDAQESYLRFVMELLPDTGSGAALDEAILDTFAELVVPRATRPAR